MKVSVKYFMILLFFCMVEYTYGQNVNVSHLLLEKDTIGNITKTIVRGYDKSAVLYIEQNGKHYFTSMSYSEPDTGHNFNLVNLKKLEIDPSYNVNDFKIVGKDYVYFCGEHIQNNDSYGFIGFFELQELLQGNMNADIKIQDNFVQNIVSTNIDRVANLDKMEVFFESDKFHLVAIGNTSNSVSCVFEMITDVVGDINGTWQFGMTNCTSEKMNDIAVTDKYVVTVGTCYSYSYSTIRRYLKQGIFSNTVDYDIAYFYPPNESASATEYLADDMDNILITPIQGDTIAIASYWYNSANQTPHLNGVLIRIYDMSSAPAPLMLASMSINQSYYNGKWELKEFMYDTIFQTFALLQNMEESQSPNSLVNSFSVIDLINMSIETVSYPGMEFTSFDRCFVSDYNILLGYDINKRSKLLFAVDKMNDFNICYGNNLNLSTNFKSIYTHKFVDEGFSIYWGNLSFYNEYFIDFMSQYMDVICRI